MAPRIGKDVRCHVWASQVKNADPRVDIVNLFGIGNGGAPMYGKVPESTGSQVYAIVFDVLPLSAGWTAISVARKYITTLDESEYTVQRGEGPQVRCAVIPLPCESSNSTAQNSDFTIPSSTATPVQQNANAEEVAAAIATSVSGLTNALQESIVRCMQESFRNFQKMSPPSSIPIVPSSDEQTPHRAPVGPVNRNTGTIDPDNPVIPIVVGTATNGIEDATTVRIQGVDANLTSPVSVQVPVSSPVQSPAASLAAAAVPDVADVFGWCSMVQNR